MSTPAPLLPFIGEMADAGVPSDQVLSWIVGRLREEPESAAERVGEDLVVFSAPHPDLAVLHSGRTFIVVGQRTGEEHARLHLSWATDCDPALEADAERVFDTFCLSLRIALNGFTASEEQLEALSELTGRPALRCPHCAEGFRRADARAEHQAACDKRPPARLSGLARRLRRRAQGPGRQP